MPMPAGVGPCSVLIRRITLMMMLPHWLFDDRTYNWLDVIGHRLDKLDSIDKTLKEILEEVKMQHPWRHGAW